MSNAKAIKALKNEILVLQEHAMSLECQMGCPVMGDYYYGEYKGVMQMINGKNEEIAKLKA